MKLKTLLLYGTLAVLFISACTDNKKDTDSLPSATEYGKFEIFRGTNIAHWLSQSSRRGEDRAKFFTRKDVEQVKTLGFDHLRLPIDEEQMWDEAGNKHEEAFQLLDSALTWCHDNQLRVIVDLHILRSHHFNHEEKPLWTDPAEREKFITLWKGLSDALIKWPVGMVAYELMNEAVADDPEQWNDLVAKAVSAIRQWEPERVIVVGSNRWQSASTFDVLKVPDDPNIILSYHFYEPFHLTHVRASWTNLKDFDKSVAYPGQIVPDGETEKELRVYNRDTLISMMRKPFHLADSLHLPLYCGEFGVIENAPRPDRLAWYRDMVSIFEEYHIGYANWNYKAGSFETVDEQGTPDEELVKILSGK